MKTVNTTNGLMDISLLTKKEGVDENADAFIEWIEYWYKGEMVHRSVHAKLKKNVLASGLAAMLS